MNYLHSVKKILLTFLVISLSLTFSSSMGKRPSKKNNKKPEKTTAEQQTVAEKKAQDAKILNNIALSAIKDGEYIKAFDILKQALDLVPEDKDIIDTRDRLAFVTDYVFSSLGTDKYDEAVRNGVVKYVIDKDPQDAVEIFQYAYSLKPDNTGLYKLVKVMARDNNITLDSSAKTWNLAEQKVYQALEKFRQKKFDECIKLCEEALDLEPTNVTAYKRLGSTFYILGDIEQAKRNWRKVIELAPRDEETAQIKQLLTKLEREHK